jgi:hypothetical protein
MRRLAAIAACAVLAACATGPGRGGDAGPVMGAQARKAHGADPVAAPPADVGNSEDPVAPKT